MVTVTDEEGNRYYDVDDACTALNISRSTFLKRAKDAGLGKWSQEGDKKVYWRVEDVEGLKNRPVKMRPVVEKPKKGRAALAFA